MTHDLARCECNALATAQITTMTTQHQRDTIAALTAELNELKTRTEILKNAITVLEGTASFPVSPPAVSPAADAPSPTSEGQLVEAATNILTESGELTSSDLRRTTGCSAPEARDTIRALRESEAIRPTRRHGSPIHGGRPPTVYVATARARGTRAPSRTSPSTERRTTR